MRSIVQVIPASGWWARFDGELLPVVCWALLEGEVEGDETFQREVMGMVADPDKPTDGSIWLVNDYSLTFRRYEHETTFI